MLSLKDGWNETSVSGVELYAESGVVQRVRFLESDDVECDHGAVIHELARYGVRPLFARSEAGEAEHECVAPVEELAL